MSEIVSKPFTPKGEGAWLNIFGKKQECSVCGTEKLIAYTINGKKYCTECLGDEAEKREKEL